MEQEIHTVTPFLRENNFVERIIENDAAALKQLYKANFEKVKMYILKNSGCEQQAKDIYQEAYVAMWRNIKNGSYTSQKDASLDGYLFTIAKHKWLDYLRSAKFKKTITLVTDVPFEEIDFEAETLKTKQIEHILQQLKNLGENCQHLLKLFYFERKSFREIAVISQIDEAYARTAKYRCLEKLRKLTQINLNENK